MIVTDRDLVILALTVYGEARGQPRKGLEAVAWVVLNRAANPRWWGKSIADCCLKAWQFSAWNHGDPNRAKMLALLEHRDPDNPVLDEARAFSTKGFPECWDAVEAVLAGEVPDPTGGATHYCTPAVADETSWARGRQPCARIGGHWFYRDVEPGVRPYKFPAKPAPAAPVKLTLWQRILRWLGLRK